jgi:excinuclease ABC subunit B
VDGRVVLYADKVTKSMAEAMDETQRRREKQQAHNVKHGIVPTTIRKSFGNMFGDLESGGDSTGMDMAAESCANYGSDPKKLNKIIKRLEREMREAAKELEFERAAELRDRVGLLRERILELR